jgi:hypothetical protein
MARSSTGYQLRGQQMVYHLAKFTFKQSQSASLAEALEQFSGAGDRGQLLLQRGGL